MRYFRNIAPDSNIMRVRASRIKIQRWLPLELALLCINDTQKLVLWRGDCGNKRRPLRIERGLWHFGRALRQSAADNSFTSIHCAPRRIFYSEVFVSALRELIDKCFSGVVLSRCPCASQ
jgi:hypothetical protein